MVKQKPYVDENGVEHEDLVVNYSDEGLPIREAYTFREYKDGIAIDPVGVNREYYEVKEEPEEVADAIEEGNESEDVSA